MSSGGSEPFEGWLPLCAKCGCQVNLDKWRCYTCGCGHQGVKSDWTPRD